MAREGLIPTILGTAVTATGMALKKRNSMSRRGVTPMLAAGIIGFGLAHVVLGSIDLIQKDRC
jgi:hypothetical protein